MTLNAWKGVDKDDNESSFEQAEHTMGGIVGCLFFGTIETMLLKSISSSSQAVGGSLLCVTIPSYIAACLREDVLGSVTFEFNGHCDKRHILAKNVSGNTITFCGTSC